MGFSSCVKTLGTAQVMRRALVGGTGKSGLLSCGVPGGLVRPSRVSLRGRVGQQ